MKPRLRHAGYLHSWLQPNGKRMEYATAGTDNGIVFPAGVTGCKSVPFYVAVEEARIKRDYCPEKLKPGGCQLHNVQCGYPRCNEPPCECNACYSRRRVDEAAGRVTLKRYEHCEAK